MERIANSVVSETYPGEFIRIAAAELFGIQADKLLDLNHKRYKKIAG